jgi:hypothetical protein
MCTSLLFAGPVAADVITEWGVIASTHIGPGRPASIFGQVGPATSIDLALVHLAMHDAVQAYDKRYETYSVRVVTTSGSPVVAAAKAAHDVLAARLHLTPAVVANVAAAYTSYIGALSPMPSAAEVAAGEVVGAAAAFNVLAHQTNFPLLADIVPFFGNSAPGQWRSAAGMVAPWLGAVRPLGIVSAADMQPDAIPPLTSLEYAEAYNEVKALGSASSTLRTSEQSQIARFFAGNAGAMFNRLMRELVAKHIGGSDLASLGDRARLFALANMATADALLCAWEQKKRYNFWRPIHAIHQGEADGNVLTIGDPTWVSLLGTPNYPDYTSGFNNISGAMTETLALFFGDRPVESFNLWLTTPALPAQPGDPNPRVYTRFSDVQQEVILARVYQGIHFRFADTEARTQGKRIARYMFRNMLTTIRER